MGSAYHLTKINILPKFNENSSRGIGDLEWTRNSKAKSHELLDLDLVPA